MPECFVIMPITTPPRLMDEYGGDRAHFDHVLEHLFVPAVEQAGYDVVPPAAQGSDLIQAEIVRRLETADLVLCDVSTLNANVFFELGIRTALDKPVCLVRDDRTSTLPFDTGIINCHAYRAALNAWELPDDVESLANHIRAATNSSRSRNTLWRYFGLTQRGASAMESVGEQSVAATLDLLLAEVRELQRTSVTTSIAPRLGFVAKRSDRIDAFVRVAEMIADQVSARVVLASADGNRVVLDLRDFMLDGERRELLQRVGAGYGLEVDIVGGVDL